MDEAQTQSVIQSPIQISRALEQAQRVLAIAGIYVFGGLGITLCYHRLLTHRGLACPKWLEYSFAILGVCAMQDTPARWVAVHRRHHEHADQREDPHSPLVNLFWSYVGWVFIENTDLNRGIAYDRYARDIVRDKFYRWIERAVVSRAVEAR